MREDLTRRERAARGIPADEAEGYYDCYSQPPSRASDMLDPYAEGRSFDLFWFFFGLIWIALLLFVLFWPLGAKADHSETHRWPPGKPSSAPAGRPTARSSAAPAISSAANGS